VEVIVMTEQDFLTIGEVCERLRLSDATVRRMLKDGRLAGVRIAGRWRVPRAAVEGMASGSSDRLDALYSLAQAGGPEAQRKARAILAEMQGEIPAMLEQVKGMGESVECAKVLELAEILARTEDDMVRVLGTLIVFEECWKLLRTTH